MKKIIFYFTILFLVSILIYFTSMFFIIKSTDIEKYNNITNQKTNFLKDAKRKPFLQTRKDVQKDIFIFKDDQRFHFRICSENSAIKFMEKQEEVKIIENLQNLKCLIQDNISFNNKTEKYEQQLRYFTADKGCYLYPSHSFFTDSININFFDLPGKNLPETIQSSEPYLKGFAKKVSFSLTDRAPQLTASHFRAFFDFDFDLDQELE